MSEVGFGGDGDYSEKMLVRKTNTALSNSYGNLVQRSLNMVYKNCEGGRFPEVVFYSDSDSDSDSSSELTENDVKLLDAVQNLVTDTHSFIEKQELHKYVHELEDVVRMANVYVEEEAPFKLKKTDFRRMEVVLRVLGEVIRGVSIVMLPVVPDGATKVLDMLGVGEEERCFRCVGEACLGGRAVQKPVGVYMRIDEIEEE